MATLSPHTLREQSSERQGCTLVGCAEATASDPVGSVDPCLALASVGSQLQTSLSMLRVFPGGPQSLRGRKLGSDFLSATSVVPVQTNGSFKGANALPRESPDPPPSLQGSGGHVSLRDGKQGH